MKSADDALDARNALMINAPVVLIMFVVIGPPLTTGKDTVDYI